VVKQAVRQTYTCYTPDEPQGRVIEDAPLAGHGRAWTLGKYRHPVYPSPLNVRVGDAGIKVWMVIYWLQLCNDDYDELVRRYGHILTPEDIEVARWFYKNNRSEISDRIKDEANL
jgi:uncharacterized protein (DUF433 family)